MASSSGASGSKRPVDERWNLEKKEDDPGPAPQFEKGVRAIMELWTALKLAVDNGWGGQDSEDKYEDLIDNVLDWFYYGKGTVYADELEITLDDYMKEMFNTDCEDESPKEVSKSLVDLYHECADGNYSGVIKLVQKAERSASAKNSVKIKKQKVDEEGGASTNHTVTGDATNGGTEEGGAGEMEAEKPKSEPIIDEDGFELVQKKGKKRR